MENITLSDIFIGKDVEGAIFDFLFGQKTHQGARESTTRLNQGRQ
jgi:hypothetical protein